ncbi:MAG TPA: radical SAM protein [Pontiella sp.]
MPQAYQYLFGPVPSRRLGRSLGVDLIPFKTCTLDCTYCQLGQTPCAVSDRGEYVPLEEVLAELDQWRVSGGVADHITLAGSGEPTLHSRFGDVFRWVKDHTDIASVLLTNGTLLHLSEVRTEAALADKVKVTLSAWDEASFRQIHRPAQGVTFQQLVDGERAFRSEYPGELSVEVFIVEGVNSAADDVRRMAAVVHSINPDRIDINTAVRPPAESSVRPSSKEDLQQLAELFGPKAVVTASFKNQGVTALDLSEDLLLGLIRRHPSSCSQLAKEYGQPEEVVARMLEKMKASDLLLSELRGGDLYYLIRSEN